jgi:uncharacterized membrane protein YkvA (DUF1232 family)
VNAKNFFAKQVYDSRFFKEAAQKARDISENPEQLNALLVQADKKAREKGRGALGESWDTLMTFSRMVKAYAAGNYRKVPWKTLVAVVGAIVYFIMPLDFVPDIILGLGFADDAALLLWIMRWFKKDMDEFLVWEEEIKGIRN